MPASSYARNTEPSSPARTTLLPRGDENGSLSGSHRRGQRLRVALRGLAALSVAIVYAAASGSTPAYTLIIGSRVELGTIQNGPPNGGYLPVNGLIGDFNGDGLPDIVIGINGYGPVLYLNNGTANPFQDVPGLFVSTPPAPGTTGVGWGGAVMADVNNDGHPDIAIAGFNTPNMIYLNDGTSNAFNGASGFAIGTQDTAYVPALGDVNGDGFVDMVVANTNHVPSRLYLTNGAPLTSGGYSTVQVGTDLGYGQNAVIADVNGDGKPDIILTYTVAETLATDPSGVVIYFNNGSSNPFANVTPVRLLVGQSISAIAVADLNGDGKADLIVSAANNANATSTLYVYLNTGSPSQPFDTPTTLQPDQNLGGPCVGITVGDVNGDGLPDLIFACEPPSPNASPTPNNPAEGAIYLNNGTASPFSQVAPVDIPATKESGFAYSTSLGQLVRNGPLDLLVADQNGLGGYSPITFDQDPSAQNDSGLCAVNKSVTINVLVNDTAGLGETLNPDSVTITTVPHHGTTSVDTTTGTVTYQPATTYSGTDSFQYTVRDKLGALSNTATVSMRVQPAPVANNDTATLQANRNVTINILANDSSSGGTLDAASVKIVVPPAHGTAVANSGGAVVYTPTAGYSGLDTFQYTVQDNLATVSNPATVSIEVTTPPGGGGGGSLNFFDLLALAGLVLIPSIAIRRPSAAISRENPSCTWTPCGGAFAREPAFMICASTICAEPWDPG